MTKTDRQRIVLVIDHEASTFKALSRIGENSGFNTLSFSDSSEFIAWLQSNTTEASRKDKTFCVVFDSQFVGLFRQHLPTWFHGAPRICISRSNKIALTLNSIRLGLFDFMAKPFPLEAMKTTLERAFTDADLQSNKPTSLESIIERIEQLTKRELEICEMLSKGLSGKQIASELAISIKTYYVHRTNLLQKTAARSSIELIRAYDVYAINRRNGDHEDSANGIEIAHLNDNSIGHENELPNFPLVSDIARKNVLQTDSDLTLRTAANLMIERDVSSIVFRKNGRLHVFSMENILEISHAGGSLDRALSQMPIEPATTIEKDKNVLDALDQLELAKTRFLIVTDPEQNDSMIGILTYSDLLSTIDPTLFLEKKNIGQIVSRKEPLTFSQEWHLDDVLCHLVQTEDSIIVVDAGKPIGIITAKDVFRIISSGQSTEGQLSEYMTHPVFSLPASATIHDALVHLKCKKVKRAVIVNEYGILIGMLTQSEVVSFAYGYWTKLFHHESHGLFELVTLLTKKAAKYETDSLTDPLTDLGNRRHLDSFIESEIERVRRYNAKTFSKLFIDIDHHKSVNDVHGHSFGDEVLKATGNAIRKLVRENDRVFRWGGDEFVVIAPHTDLSEAEILASRIRTCIESLSLSKEHRVTVSIGIGEYSPVEGLKSFFDRVDQALYQAKSLGRNRVEISSLNATLALIEESKSVTDEVLRESPGTFLKNLSTNLSNDVDLESAARIISPSLMSQATGVTKKARSSAG